MTEALGDAQRAAGTWTEEGPLQKGLFVFFKKYLFLWPGRYPDGLAPVFICKCYMISVVGQRFVPPFTVIGSAAGCSGRHFCCTCSFLYFAMTVPPSVCPPIPSTLPQRTGAKCILLHSDRSQQAESASAGLRCPRFDSQEGQEQRFLAGFPLPCA